MKYPRIILILFIFCLIGVGIFYLSNNQEGNETPTQTAQNLKLLNSHSHPEAGEEWVVSFETEGNADLTITPEDKNSIEDLDFVSLTCNGEEKIETGPPSLLDDDVIFYSNWQCAGKGELTHLVNIARKHTLKFSFGNVAAFAYNNSDSVTDSFNNTDYIATSSNITVSGGQVYLSTCKDNGTACSSPGECCSNYCVDDVCCGTSSCPENTCETCGIYSSAGAGTCGYVNDSGQDPDSECTTASPPNANSCKSATCNGTGYACGYLAAGEQSQPVCKRCSGSSYDPVNVTDDTGDSEGSNQCDADNGDCYRCSSGSCTFQTAAQDLFSECPGALGTCAATTCSGSGYSCGYLSGNQGCATCKYCTGASYSCSNRPNNYDCGTCVCCNGAGSCNNWCYEGTRDYTSPGTCTDMYFCWQGICTFF